MTEIPYVRQPAASIVIDNLIHRGEMSVTIGVFIDPGEPENRNVEYDAFSDAYATFLPTEILPNVQDRYVITDDADQWAVGGGSSGGNCAFTAGAALYLLAHVAFLFRTTGRVFRRRTIGSVALLALVPAALAVPALAALALVSAVCSLVVAYEAIRYREHRVRVRHPEVAA